jgi:hypothetical protein
MIVFGIKIVLQDMMRYMANDQIWPFSRCEHISVVILDLCEIWQQIVIYVWSFFDFVRSSIQGNHGALMVASELRPMTGSIGRSFRSHRRACVKHILGQT